MLTTQYVTDSTSHCPCDDCHYSKFCKHECIYFKEYCQTESPARREEQLKVFIQEQASWLESA